MAVGSVGPAEAAHHGGDAAGAHRVRHGHLLGLAAVEPEPDVGDRQLVARPEPTGLDTLAVDADAVGGAQVPDLDFAIYRRHAAMPARDPDRVEPGVALRVTPDDQHGPVDRDVGALIQGHQADRHGAVLTEMRDRPA